jgi:hypothetical protein
LSLEARQRTNRRKSNTTQDHPSDAIHKRTPFDPDLIHDTCQIDPDLATVVHAWDRLPEAVRAGIVAMVKAAAKGGWPMTPAVPAVNADPVT